MRELRTQLGMTLDGLAAKCDVSRSMLSLVERGESSPTAVVLEKIATGLGIALAGLFDDAGVPASPISRRSRPHYLARSAVRLPAAEHLACQLPLASAHRGSSAAGWQRASPTKAAPAT